MAIGRDLTPDERRQLIDTAMGRIDPDLVIVGGRIVNVHTREIHEGEVVVAGERIAAVVGPGEAPREGVPTVIDASGEYLIPGFIDPHMHIESSNVRVGEFARAVLPRGITTVVADPHEIANVLGLKGMRLFCDEADALPFNFYLRVPPRVPELAPHLETCGAELTLEETKTILDWPESACLAGDINPYHTVNADQGHLERIAYTAGIGKTVSGYSPGLADGELNAYLAAGVEDSHTPGSLEELIDDLRHGLNVILTPRTNKFGPEEFERLAELLRNQPIDTSMISFCTDDIWIHEVVRDGHLDLRIRLAIEKGVQPILAYQMATLNPARLMRLDRHLGSIAPGKIADIVFMQELESVRPTRVMTHGRLVVRDGHVTQATPDFTYPQWAKSTMNLGAPAAPQDFMVRPKTEADSCVVNVIEFSWPKKMVEERLTVANGAAVSDISRDILHLSVRDRHTASGRCGNGFVRGIGLKRGAVAGTINHNSHNVFAIGTDFESMATAVNELTRIGGGYAAAVDDKVIGRVTLPIGGLMSEKPFMEAAAEFEDFEKLLYSALGCSIPARPLYTLSFLCCPGVRHVGMTDFGLLNTDTLELHDVLVSDPQ